MKLFRTVLATLLLAAYASVAYAQTPPKPKEFYFDEDAAAQPIVVVKAQGDALAEALMRERERGRKQVEATAQLARLAMNSDRAELGKSLYEQALLDSSANSTVGRSVRWNFGWDLYRASEPEAALAQWSDSILSVGGPSWAPPTLAIALWSADRRTAAVEWYAAAVRTYPRRWSDTASFATLLPDWRQEERDVLAKVHAAWLANPPVWP